MASEFPGKRFREAGATKAEVAQLSAEYGRSDATAQGALATFASQPTSALREHLDVLRASGHFGEASETDDTTVDEGDDETVDPDEPSTTSDDEDDNDLDDDSST